jgi:hypothetical protein
MKIESKILTPEILQEIAILVATIPYHHPAFHAGSTRSGEFGHPSASAYEIQEVLLAVLIEMSAHIDADYDSDNVKVRSYG